MGRTGNRGGDDKSIQRTVDRIVSVGDEARKGAGKISDKLFASMLTDLRRLPDQIELC